jgi:hypothetical protein
MSDYSLYIEYRNVLGLFLKEIRVREFAKNNVPIKDYTRLRRRKKSIGASVFLKRKSKIFASKTRSPLKKYLRPIFERSEKEGVNRLKWVSYFLQIPLLLNHHEFLYPQLPVT